MLPSCNFFSVATSYMQKNNQKDMSTEQHSTCQCSSTTHYKMSQSLLWTSARVHLMRKILRSTLEGLVLKLNINIFFVSLWDKQLSSLKHTNSLHNLHKCEKSSLDYSLCSSFAIWLSSRQAQISLFNVIMHSDKVNFAQSDAESSSKEENHST